MKEIVIAGAVRTPIGGFMGGLSSLPASKLGEVAITEALGRAGVEPADARQAVILDVLQALGDLNALRRRWERAVARLEDAQADYLEVEVALKTATSTAESDMAELDALHEALVLAETRHTRFRLAAEELERTVFQAADRCGEMLLQTETGD